MQKLFILLSLVFLYSCGNSALDHTFDPERYALDIDIIQRQGKISLSDLVLLNYVVLRQNDYFNYSIEGKTYQEILELAKTLNKEGMPYEEVFDIKEDNTNLLTKFTNEGTGAIRQKEGSKRLIKVMKFKGEFTNTTDKDLVLLNSTILLKGPFKKHITSAGYELNCLISPGNTLKVDFILDAKNIQRNILFFEHYKTPQFFIDSLITNSSLSLAGNTITTNTEFFETCVFDGQRVEPFKYYEYQEDFDKEKQIMREGGKTVRFEYGDPHFTIKENDTIINYR